MDVKIGRWLDCGCCGTGFKTWEGYKNQDQDSGYGLCQGCQGEISEHDEDEFDRVIACVRDGLNPENQTKFNGYDRDTQKAIAYKALEDGQIKFVMESV